MKKLSLFLLFCGILSLANGSAFKEDSKTDEHIATCYGNKNCYACKSCRYCAHCNSGGGSCGVCSSSVILPIKSTIQKTSIGKSTSNMVTSSQCKGTTKKGQRCKRLVKGGGYCWQHK